MVSKVSTILFLLLIVPAAAQEFKIISSNRNSITVEYSPSFTDTSTIKINNQEFINIALKQGFISNDLMPGAPLIYKRSVEIGVPSEFGNTIRILNTFHKELSGKLAPVPAAIKDKNNMIDFSFKTGSGYNNFKDNSELVSFGEFGNLRGIPVQSVILSPIEFDPSQNLIKLYTKIVFQINFSSNQKISSNPADDFAAGAILNFDAARYWTTQNNSKRLRKVDNSVLASGKWVRFEAPEEGIYKITRDMLSSYGIDANSVDPRTIKIYNNGGKMLPENLTSSKPEDLVENAILVSGESDGKFDANDYILFYGRGNHFWDYDTTSNQIKRYFHLYSKQNYYWITSGGSQGKRIQNKSSLNQAAHFTQSSTDAFADWDEDKINIMQSGRIFVGDLFQENSNSRTYMNKLDGRIDGTPVNYKFSVVNASQNSVTLEVFENSSRIYSKTLSGFGTSPLVHRSGYEYTQTVTFNPELADDRSLLKFQFNINSAESKGYLDYFEISFKKELKAFNNYLLFFSKDTSAVIEYDLSGFSNSNIKVFDITDYSNLKLISSPITQSGSEFRFQANEVEGSVSKYLAIGNDNFKSPSNPVEMANQNLHSISPGAKFIIITNKAFEEQANRLKNYRENESKVKMSTIVVDIDKIYNEFSGGILDVTAIRDFIKYAYDYWTVKPEYVLLFGDGTYDYKNITGANNNFIPPYETTEYLDEVESYPMDDYFVRINGNDGKSDLAIGRLNVQTLTEAEICINKIIDYENNQDEGLWRSLITLVADDGLTTQRDDGSLHTSQSETLADIYIPKFFDIHKIYLAAYPTVITGFGRTKPAVNQAIIDAVNQGTLILNYIGHGSPELWAHENVFINSSSIPQMNNDKYFLLTAATCDFGYFDKTDAQSGAELLMLKENSGAIGAFTATRPVYSDDNAALNNTFFNRLLGSPRDTLNYTIPIGKAFFLAKSSRTNRNDNKFHYFGDPTVRLLVPQYTAQIDSVNGQVVNGLANVQIKALSSSRINGEIKKPDNSNWNDFNGEAILSVFDSERKVPLEQLNNYVITLQGGVIFRGKISITNGKFDAGFVVPKDISYQNQNGKIVVYFFNNNVDGIGYTENVIVGGTDSSAVNDGNGPEIDIYFDKISDNNSYLVSNDSKLIVDLSDQTGLNTTGTGIGHKIEGILNDKINNPIDFSNYFTGDLDSGGKSGKINYLLSGLENGDYKIDIKAWDVFNNFSTETSYFTIVNNDKLVVRDIYNYPNPFSSNTTFTFQQNLNSPLNLKIKIYTIAGRLIKEIERNNVNEKFVTVPWNGRDEDGSIIANGTYLYKLIVKTVDGKYSQSALGKLAVIR